MNTSMSIPIFLALFFVLLLTEGCKIEITVPEGGKVVSASHAYDCGSGKTCVVEVNDFHFAETFDAHAWEGWIFIGWKVDRGYLCKRSESVCHLSNKGLGQYEAISAIVESDETLFLEPEFVKATPYDEALDNVQDESLRVCLNSVPPPRKYAQQVRNVDCSTSFFRIGSVQGIEAFSRIEHLGFTGNGSLTDLQPLGKLSRLQNLDLGLESSYFNAAALGELKLLDYLSLWIPAPNPDLTEMDNLQSLRKLRLRALSLDLNSIGSLVNLRKLYLRWNQISDIGPLAGLTNLKYLDLANNEISDIGPLAGMTKLETLYLFSNEISDIGPLAGMTKLETLALNSNQISDIGPLAEIDSIENLSLTGNSISDVSPLKQHYPLAQNPSFVVLDISHNPIQSTGDALDGIRVGRVDLFDVPLSCEEYSRLEGLYDSRWILTSQRQFEDIFFHGDDYSYVPPLRCR